MKDFDAYIALGDSMSINRYPSIDLKQEAEAPVGAAALLYRNHAEFWPEFIGKDLLSYNPKMRVANLAADGATTWDLLDDDFHSLLRDFKSNNVLITLTLGGNDVLRLVWKEDASPSSLVSESAAIVERYERVLRVLQEICPNSTTVLTTIYDPSDGTGVIPGYNALKEKMPFLNYINGRIRDFGKGDKYLLADAHQHFMGHGLTGPAEDCYYWKASPIEPSAIGASQLRALWLKTLSTAGLLEDCKT